MAYEIDFLAVGNGERSGDAIALRFGNLQQGQQTVVVIDGGTKESGEALVNHIKTYYKTETVDAVICTHSDGDHVCGLTVVLESLTVRKLLMHLPWEHAHGIDDVFKDERITANSLMAHFKKSLDNAHQLAKLAQERGIPIVEPFSDTIAANETWAVLSPSVAFYEELLKAFRCAPELSAETPFLQKAVIAVKEAIKWIAEDWNIETLSEPEVNATSAENNSSVVLLFKDGDAKFLFTSDAGVPALAQAVKSATGFGIDLKTVNGIQIPHHGSKRNVGPAVLNAILGPKMQTETYSKTAIVSVSKGAPKHPSKKVVNAFMRRGARVYATQGMTIWHHSNDAPARQWGPAPTLPFLQQVEE